jgi:multiple sugar transport system permease protein
MEKLRSKVAKKEAIEGFLFISPWLVGFCAFVAGPMIASLYLSFTKWELLDRPVWVGFQNYITMFFEDPLFWKSLYNTIYYTFLAVPLGIIAALSLALLLNQDIKGLSLYRTLYYLPTVTSGVATAILWVWIFNPNIGLLNYFLSLLHIQGPRWLGDPGWAKFSLVIMSLWGAGGGMIIYLAGLKNIPIHLYEAAKIDGANSWQIFWNITIPQLTPTIFFNLIMGLIGAFQTFTNAYVMTQGGPVNSTLFYVLYLYNNAFQYYHMGYASSMAWFLFIIVILVTLLQFRLARRWVYYETQR